MKKFLLLLLLGSLALNVQAAPKKLLVVTTTTGFRHSSIPTLEKVLAQLGKESGDFTVDFVEQPPGHPATGFSKKLNADATPEQKQAYAAAEAKFEAALKKELQKLSPENLKHYDGVVFASTTGDLPIPDPQGLLDWIKAGHAFIGIHAASDTFHHWPGYREMLGGEFDHHGAQLGVECLNEDPSNPATAHLGKTWEIKQEEIYQFKNYDPAKVHELLILDKKPQAPFTPGHYPVSWCKTYGAGHVFYTSLGHREDLIDADPHLKGRINPVATSKEYEQHVLGGIEWALGIKKD
jgi:type 1 glutamine amidotransferase